MDRLAQIVKEHYLTAAHRGRYLRVGHDVPDRLPRGHPTDGQAAPAAVHLAVLFGIPLLVSDNVHSTVWQLVDRASGDIIESGQVGEIP